MKIVVLKSPKVLGFFLRKMFKIKVEHSDDAWLKVIFNIKKYMDNL